MDQCTSTNEFMIRGKVRAKENTDRWVSVYNERLNPKMEGSKLLTYVGVVESVARVFRLRKKPMNLCVSNIEDRENGVVDGVNSTMMSEHYPC
jgi:hypothetical protein